MDSKFTCIITKRAYVGTKKVLFGVICATNYRSACIFWRQNPFIFHKSCIEINYAMASAAKIVCDDSMQARYNDIDANVNVNRQP